MPEYTPTDEQRELLGHRADRHARVLAGPGTGKSATLVALIDSLMDAEQRPKLKLLTFTRAATAELGKKVSDHPSAASERPSTIHSFAISVLLRNPGAGGFPEPLRIADDWENEFIVQPTLRDRSGFSLRDIGKFLLEMSANWESLTQAQDPQINAADRARFLGSWNEHRRIYGYTLLAELPYALRRALVDHAELEGVDFDVLVVDEYQDLNACDLEILRLVAGRGCSIIGAGDDDQSIYSFRKAAPEGIRRFPNDYPNAGDYSLSVSLRCGSKIIEWANYVIAGDTNRPKDKPFVTAHPDSPPGEVGLLAFPGQASEASGVAYIVKQLVEREGLKPSDVLILLRTDFNGGFSRPIKQKLSEMGIACSDPDVVPRLLAEEPNRRLLALVRLLTNEGDSLAWATLLTLAPGIGKSFFNYIYERARPTTRTFAETLLELHGAGFPEGPAAPCARAKRIIDETQAWLRTKAIPEERPEEGWGSWILELAADAATPTPTDEFATLLKELDPIADQDHGLSRFLGQLQPLGRDLAQAKSDGIRIMTMMSSKGLTVRATILPALEDGLVPRPNADLSEERRILYVAMTRAKEFLFGTWAAKRVGPTSRAGLPSQDLRRHSHFLDNGPVHSIDAKRFLLERWEKP
jgi:DNA helicase II / ATP-dependent DNA helicase PcrA